MNSADGLGLARDGDASGPAAASEGGEGGRAGGERDEREGDLGKFHVSFLVS